MKKHLLIITFLLTAFWPQAQTIPNSDFEDWEDVHGWYLKPVYWCTNNCQLMNSVLQDTIAYSGNYAILINYKYSSIKGYASSRFPFDLIPAAISAFVKCEIPVTDTVSILVYVFADSQIVDYGKWSSTSSISEWTLITIPISQNSSSADSLEIQIIGGDSLQTSLSVDSFSFEKISGINSSKSLSWSVYPNPFTNNLKYELPGIDENRLILFEIIDVYGRTLAGSERFTSKGELNLQGIPCGTYILKISTTQSVFSRILIKN